MLTVGYLLTYTWILTLGYLHLLTHTWILTLGYLQLDTCYLTLGYLHLLTHTWMHLTFCARTTFAHQPIFQLTPTHFPPSHAVKMFSGQSSTSLGGRVHNATRHSAEQTNEFNQICSHHARQLILRIFSQYRSSTSHFHLTTKGPPASFVENCFGLRVYLFAHRH